MLLWMNCYLNFILNYSLLVQLIFVQRSSSYQCAEIVFIAEVFVLSLGHSTFRILSFVNKVSFNYSFLIWIPSIYFSCFIALVRIPSTTLNRSSEVRYLCFVLYFKSGWAFNLLSLSMKLAKGLLYVLFYQIEKAHPLFLIYWKFLS